MGTSTISGPSRSGAMDSTWRRIERALKQTPARPDKASRFGVGDLDGQGDGHVAEAFGATLMRDQAEHLEHRREAPPAAQALELGQAEVDLADGAVQLAPTGPLASPPKAVRRRALRARPRRLRLITQKDRHTATTDDNVDELRAQRLNRGRHQLRRRAPSKVESRLLDSGQDRPVRRSRCRHGDYVQ
jgi:hypothetical protein